MDTIYESNVFSDSFNHIGKCVENNKPIKQLLTIDDGTGKLYTYELQKNLTWKPYTISPNFETLPLEPNVLEETKIIPQISDPYDVVGYRYKDQNHIDNIGDLEDFVLPVDYDFNEDGKWDKFENI